MGMFNKEDSKIIPDNYRIKKVIEEGVTYYEVYRYVDSHWGYEGRYDTVKECLSFIENHIKVTVNDKEEWLTEDDLRLEVL